MENSAAELNPLTRALVIALMISVPILLVILQRLPEIREILSHPKSEGREILDSPWSFQIGGGRNVSIFPKCIRQNPPYNKFCGFCGTEMIFLKKEN